MQSESSEEKNTDIETPYIIALPEEINEVR